ncbi:MULTISPECIES: geranylgeranylglyceryl/heptaprenylglyceryl phosphate synthase [unclassified Aureispira]|uniref:geranylgeranylglyceryl/heptaprenylglyceryl phosphate synthase n=1 Tax=unclassified Aureispira TaxID=2649989 RepID=UPI0006984A4B|nr:MULTISPECIES: geranylgeranylglyceryl/heptaprenylglyceryl phosphate synthase [unclassified Aureispira]WMX16148.1 geranylgeranylglyceryl/heptaprenylglyceryl phosphate synthase [Aureispira sp. CCB-E]
MNTNQIYTNWRKAKEKQSKEFAVLIDPDKLRLKDIDKIVELAEQAAVDSFFIGGSLVVNDALDDIIMNIKKNCNIPVVLFPGSSRQLSYKADGLLFLSLISGRNPELLIGKHVETAPFLKISPVEIISTGYILVDGGVPTSVSYMSNTQPIPANKDSIAVCTAMAGEMLGLKLIYMDAGSGAQNPISTSMIESVSMATEIPLIIGGGIKTPEKASANVKAGADIIVVGNAIEKDPQLILELAAAVHEG